MVAKKFKKGRKPKQPPRLHGWLWWTALFIAIIGGVTAYVFAMDGTHQSDLYSRATIMITIVAVGICIISAVSDRFF